MKIPTLLAIMMLTALAAQPAAAQGTGQTSQSGGTTGSRYSIDGRGGGVPTANPQATQPVPPATSVYPYANQSRTAPLVGQPTNVPLGTVR